MRGCGPIGWPGSAEVVNMQPPDALLKKGITRLPTNRRRPPVGHLRQSVDPQRCARERGGRRLSWLRTGDTIRIDAEKGRCDALVSEEEIARRKQEAPPPIPGKPKPLARNSPAPPPASSTRAPW